MARSSLPCLRSQKRGHPRIFMNQEHRFPDVFRECKSEDFLEVRSKKTFLASGRSSKTEERLNTAGRLVDAFTNIRSGSDSQVSKGTAPPLSELCRTCYKAYGSDGGLTIFIRRKKCKPML